MTDMDKDKEKPRVKKEKLLYHFDVMNATKMSNDPYLSKAIMLSSNMVLGISVTHPRAAFYLMPTEHFFETFGQKEGISFFNDAKDKVCQHEPKYISEDEFPNVVQRINEELKKLVH